MYFAYFAAGSLFVTYVPLHFAALGLSAAAIGWIFGVRTVLATVFQPVITARTERSGRPLATIARAAVFGTALIAALPFATGFWTLAVPIWIAAPGFAAIVPVLDAAVVRAFGVPAYGRIRAWGSAGFGVMVAAYGVAIRGWTSEDAGRAALVLYLVTSFAGTAIAVWLARGEQPSPRPDTRTWMWPGPGFALFVFASALHWGSLNVFNVFLALHTTSLGMDVWVPGAALGVAIVAEVLGFVLSARFRAIGAMAFLVTVCVAGVVRWGVVAFSDVEALTIGVQLLHLLSFGGWFAVVIALLGRFGGEERRGSVQGVFAALCFGLGGAASSVVGGWAFEWWGGKGAFALAAALEVAAAAAYAHALRRGGPVDSAQSSAPTNP